MNCWNWLLELRPEYETIILNKLSNAWAWTIDEKKGLFHHFENEEDSSQNSKNSFFMNEENTEEEDEEYKIKIKQIILEAEAHRIWIQFLSERLNSTYKNQQLAQSYQKMFLKGVSQPLKLNTLPQTIGTRFQLLTLCLDFINGPFIKDFSTKGNHLHFLFFVFHFTRPKFIHLFFL